MIVKDKSSWLRMVLDFRGGLPRTWTRVATVTLLSVVVTYVYHQTNYPSAYSLTPLPFTLIGIALGIFLGFRNNECYDRYWEGRQLWGQMVNVARSFTRQVLVIISPPEDELNEQGHHPAQRELVHRTIAYVHALRHHLRGTSPFVDLSQFLDDTELEILQCQRNVPLAILQGTAERVRVLWQRGWLHDLHLPVLEGSLTHMTDIQGGCERIKLTPIPYTYSVLIHRIVGFFCLFLPFGIVTTVHLMTPVVVLLISHAFFGLDAIGDEIEDPFGTDPHDLPLGAISQTVEINLTQLLGGRDVCELPTPTNGLLL
jgi:putative membrane protein